ncbi:MAG: hypothetical protein HC882_08300 [Acidobacteria bacterium]|nr:hypothetical protein [Acidobacteriota bacterium]
MIAALFRALVLGFFVWLVGKLFGAIIPRQAPSGSSGPTSREPTAAGPRTGVVAGRLVRDPHCHVAIPESRAIRHGEHFFCSRECLEAYLGARSERA